MERGATGEEPTGSVEMSQERPNTAFIDRADPSKSGPVYQFQGHRQSFAEQNDATAGGLTDDRTAVSALMQLQGTTGQTTYQTRDAIRVTEGNQLTNHTPDMTNFYNHSRLYQSRSDTGMQFQLPAYNRTQTYPTFSGNTDCSGSSTQDAVTNLNNAFSNMQQQQALMSERQESISNALCNLTSMLQDMRDGSQSHNLNTNSTVAGLEARASLPNGRQQGQGTFDTGLSANPDSYENGDYMVSERQTLQDSRVSQLRDGYFQDTHTSCTDGNIQQQGWTEDRPLSNTWRERHYQRPQEVGRTNSASFPEAKLPPFNGKEEWKVWLNRFEAVAKRRNWNNDAKLDNLLPRLQGRAGDFVYNQLSQETLSCYPELIKELNSRFRVVETQRTFAAKFSQRAQRPNETVEEYAAELKRLYSKAYKFRDNNTRQEDLVRRFLDGLKDNEARFEIEFHKEPEDIDEAVFHAVNFIQSKRRNASDSYMDRKLKKYARRTSQESDTEDSEVESLEEREDCEYALRLPTKGDLYQKKRPQKSEQITEQNTSQVGKQSDSMTEIKDMVKALSDQVAELQKSKTPAVDQQQGAIVAGNNGVLCYSCNCRGHIARNCPNKSRAQRPRNNQNGQMPSKGREEGKEQRNTNPLN